MNDTPARRALNTHLAEMGCLRANLDRYNIIRVSLEQSLRGAELDRQDLDEVKKYNSEVVARRLRIKDSIFRLQRGASAKCSPKYLVRPGSLFSASCRPGKFRADSVRGADIAASPAASPENYWSNASPLSLYRYEGKWWARQGLNL